MVVCGYLQASFTLPSEKKKSPGVNRIGSWVWIFREEKNILPLLRIKPQPVAQSIKTYKYNSLSIIMSAIFSSSQSA